MIGIAKRTSLAMLGLGLLAAFTGCASLNVRSDASASVNVSVCKTFSWPDPPGGRPDPFSNPLNDQRLRDAVARRLQSHGITLAIEGRGDCEVDYAFGSRPAPDDGRPRVSVGIGTGWGAWGRGMGSVFWDAAPDYYRENRVSLDLYRLAPGPGGGREPLWHASVETDLATLTGAEAERRIESVVTAMFTKFPSAH